MATVMGGGGGIGDWGRGPFDGEDENLSIDVDELLDLLDEDPVKDSLENVSSLDVLANPSVPADGTMKDIRNDENVCQVWETGRHGSLPGASNTDVEAYYNDQHQFPDDSEWHKMLHEGSCSFPSSEEIDPGFGPEFEYSNTDTVGPSWQDADQFIAGEVPAHSLEMAGCSYGSEINNRVSHVGRNCTIFENAAPVCQPLPTKSGAEMAQMKDERVDLFRLQTSKLIKQSFPGKILTSTAEKSILSLGSPSTLSCISQDALKQSLKVSENCEKGDRLKLVKRARLFEDAAHAFKSRSSIEDKLLGYNAAQRCLSSSELSSFGKIDPVFRIDETSKFGSRLHGVPLHSSPESSQSNSDDFRSLDGDADICIIEEMSHPARPNLPVAVINTPASHGNLNYGGVGLPRPRVNSEQLVFRVALQDLSQPKLEDSPPPGALAVPLLRHQRIALSWMVKKETAINCSGGILADDQGLGKTVSTIALILKERPPSFRPRQQSVQPDNVQNLDSDSDDENDDIKGSQMNVMKSGCNVSQVPPHGTQERSHGALAQGNGRPAAGTLVVCPTSVLRQWADELQSKVSDVARLSVLVYHGGNRTKDPLDLTKYDVVLTTYSIVSMEVPKQPLVDKEGDERRKHEDQELPPAEISTSKRKDSFSKKKKSKDGKIADAFLESISGPLAKVGWFRVVLDEAQSIKNHRTQVARACWGLRAKRRWCLSGTPIQNAIDDLYSYFRFLRYDPYAAYKTFCASIKGPIQRSPTKGYKKLQAILKTIMLRRTKGTLLDGEPIITLPPKSVELKKVDFSEEERDFYLKLEADSRAQFEEYAAAGTVKENYVNILLMLLRLRQACDHPLLVKGNASNSSSKSSIQMARKLPREKQMHLLKCLEASLAICGICSDPPEEAVVSVCGHVFCNQCVSEHLNGDNGHCAAANCKAKLTMASVFSRVSLSSALSGNWELDDSTEHLGATYSGNSPPGSSKIKAAMEVLQTLSNKAKNLDVIGASNAPSVNVVDDKSNDGNFRVAESSSDTKKPAGEKAIVFSQWTGMLDLLEACLKDSSIQYRRLDGTMSVLARDKAVKDFNTVPEVTVMIMSLKAASLGLNMVSACHVLLLDLWWNPTTEDQAIDRAHRIGQTRPVTVLRLTVKDTVEDRILALQQKKRVMVASAFGEDESGGRQSRLTVEDLAYLFMA
ncbi:hypothetical protein MLD38_016763 [Melastoma candidum]|uniref:Uncharacterized protein n=1 Tax=Melastoma candidum TaxID=119954 RepID=A0ACB9QMT9_9MYRT|nr:hypothetical protein MLD38_016763 [Melastoma candidum]